MGATWLASAIANSFPGAECVGHGQWTASCPLCQGKVVILIHRASESVGVACHGQGCPRDTVLTAVGIDPGFAGLYRPEEAKRVQTPLAFLGEVGDALESRLDALGGFFPTAKDDPLWRDPEWQVFLKLGATEPAFYADLINRMGAQFWPKEARDNYLGSLEITNPIHRVASLTETKTPIVVTAADVRTPRCEVAVVALCG